jgi:2-amino-4-hydroxy-6-hydroxymethyldihydropteridine diphosphokinase
VRAQGAIATCRTVHLGVGSNIEPARNIRAAIHLLARRMKVRDVSPVYRSRAVGRTGPDFLNLAIAVSCRSTLWALKIALDEIEVLLGRPRLTARGQRPRARTIDLDILLDGSYVGSYGTRPWRLPHPDTRPCHARPDALIARQYPRFALPRA